MSSEDKELISRALVDEANKYIDEGKSPIEIIKQLRLAHNIDLAAAKGIYVFAKEGISLGEYQERIIKDLEPLLNQMENEEWEVDRIQFEVSANLSDEYNPKSK